jgi:hypothetical protein
MSIGAITVCGRGVIGGTTIALTPDRPRRSVMLTKVKVALVLVGSLLVGGVGLAAAQGAKADTAAQKQEWKANRAEKKAEMLAKYDTNKDGKLDQAERAVMKNERAEIQFKKLDKDGNGQISLDEFKAGRMQARGHGHKHGGFRHGKAGGGQP